MCRMPKLGDCSEARRGEPSNTAGRLSSTLWQHSSRLLMLLKTGCVELVTSHLAQRTIIQSYNQILFVVFQSNTTMKTSVIFINPNHIVAKKKKDILQLRDEIYEANYWKSSPSTCFSTQTHLWCLNRSKCCTEQENNEHKCLETSNCEANEDTYRNFSTIHPIFLKLLWENLLRFTVPTNAASSRMSNTELSLPRFLGGSGGAGVVPD